MLKTTEVQNVIQELLNEYGTDHVAEYPRYKLAVSGEPVCIVGHILARLEPEAFAGIQPSDNAHPIYLFPSYHYVTFESRDLEKRLSILQKAQDNRNNWGDSVTVSRIMELEGAGVSA